MPHCALMPPLTPASRLRGSSRPLAVPDCYSALLHHGCNPQSVLMADWALQYWPWPRLALPPARRRYFRLGKGAGPLPPEVHREDRQAMCPAELARVRHVPLDS